MSRLFDSHYKDKAEAFELRLVDGKSVQSYLNDIPYYDKSIVGRNIGIDNFDNFGNAYMKFALLSHFGGVWIDEWTVLTEDLSWMEAEKLQNNRDVKNRLGDDVEVVMFASSDRKQ